MRWGLIPSFTKPHAKPDHFIMFNARSESLHERPAFRRLLETKRCIIFSDGYYEWQQVDKREKQPYYIYRSTGPLKFAGLYDTWENEQGEQMYTYTVLTSEASPEMSWMHTRMPVMLTDEGAARWLSEAKFDTLRDLLVGYRGDDLKNHPVDRKVGSTKFQSEDCSKKVDIKHAANITSFFATSPPRIKKPKPVDHAELLSSPHAPTASVPSPGAPIFTNEEPGTSSQPQIGSASTSQDDGSTSSQIQTDAGKVAAASPLLTRSPIKSQRSEAFRSPIKFLFQQQHMVQQAEDMLIASQAASASTNGTSATSTASQESSETPTKPLHSSFVPASALLRSEMGTKRSLPTSSPPKHPKPSPKRAKKLQPSPKKPTGKNPQRGTLLAFFQPKP